MNNIVIARTLFKRTYDQEYFSVNDLRKPVKGGKSLHELFKNPNEIGGFFSELEKRKLAIKVGLVRTIHKEAHGRRVWRWKWTNTAISMFGHTFW